MASAKVIVSHSDAEREAKLGEYFREYLAAWFAKIVLGVRFSPGVMRELAMALLEHAAAALIASSDSAADEPDEATAERAKKAAREAFDVMQREVLS